MTQKNYNVEVVKKGQYMSWFVTTQAANKITVKLFDEKKVYFEASKQSVNINPALAQGDSFVEGEHLELLIISSGSKEIKISPNSSEILSSVGKKVGEVFTLAAEDGDDEDFNDVFVVLSAWNNAH